MAGFVFYRVLYNSVVRPIICQGLYFIGFFIIALFAQLYVRFVFYRVLYNSVVRLVICQGLYFIVLFALLYVRVYILLTRRKHLHGRFSSLRGQVKFNPTTFYWSACTKSYICMLGVSIFIPFYDFLLGFRIVLKVWYCFFFIMLEHVCILISLGYHIYFIPPENHDGTSIVLCFEIKDEHMFYN